MDLYKSITILAVSFSTALGIENKLLLRSMLSLLKGSTWRIVLQVGEKKALGLQNAQKFLMFLTHAVFRSSLWGQICVAQHLVRTVVASTLACGPYLTCK